MRKTCPDCYARLLPIDVLAEGLPLLQYMDRLGAQPDDQGVAGVKGVIQPARCPACDQVLFYVVPSRAGERPARRPPAPGPARPKPERRTVVGAHRPPAPKPPPPEVPDALEERAQRAQREARLRALLESGTPESVPLLIELFDVFEREDKLSIIRALGRVGGELAVSTLLQWLALETPLRRACFVALVAIGPRADTEAGLLQLLEQPDRGYHQEVIGALARVGLARSIVALEPFTRGLFRRRDLRQAAVEALAALRARVTVAPDGALSVAPDTPGGGLTLGDWPGRLSVRSEEPADPAS
jgi:hypothetical protein